MDHIVSYFPNVSGKKVQDLPISEVFTRIKNDSLKLHIEAIRGEQDEKKREMLKRKTPAITVSGQFRESHSIKDFSKHSGLVQVDFDKLESPADVKTTLVKDKYTFSCFTSPSGTGVKVIAKIPADPDMHETAFDSLSRYYSSTYGYTMDGKCKDISRLCFLSWDPDIYINEESSVFEPQIESPAAKIKSVPREQTFERLDDQVEKVVSAIESSGKDITTGYDNWLKLGFALAEGLGINGLGFYKRLSQLNPDYKPSDCEKQFQSCLKGSRQGITIRTFFQMAKDQGIDIHPSRKEGWPKAQTRAKTAREHEPEEDSLELEEPRNKKLTSNKFILASHFIEEHYDIRHNIVTNEYECREKGEDSYEMMNENNIFIKMQFSGLNISLNNLVALLKSNFIEKYDPFREYFAQLPPWDQKTDHILHLGQFVKTTDRKRFDLHFKKWLVRVVACALDDNYFNKQAFILVHDRQNSGKSTFCRFLCPPSLANYIAENLSIDKDSRILLTRNLLINLDELSTLSKVEINSLKSLFSKDKINDRLPYDRRNSIIPRRCSFIGSTNQSEFLNDESGSVRWLCFVIEEIDWDYRNQVKIDLVYAQAYHLYKTGFEYNLTQEEIRENEEYNKQFQLISSERELVSQHIQPGSREDNDQFMTATDILLMLSARTESMVKMTATSIGKAMKFCGIERVKHSSQKIYGYYIKMI